MELDSGDGEGASKGRLAVPVQQKTRFEAEAG
jgi:hypothetical protein